MWVTDCVPTSLAVPQQCSTIHHGIAQGYCECLVKSIGPSNSHSYRALQPEQVARQSIYSVDLYNQQPVSHAATGTGGYSTALSTEHSPPSSRRPSQIQSSWSADGHNQEEDVLIIPQKNRR